MSPIRRYLPHLLVGLTISLIMVGAYAAVGFASSTGSKVIWSSNPVTIKFTATTGSSSGSTTDFFKCAPPVTNVVLSTSVSSTKIKLTVAPTSQATCGPSYDGETLTAMCQTLTAAQCRGTYTGTVTVHRSSPYGNTIPPSLTVNIVVN